MMRLFGRHRLCFSSSKFQEYTRLMELTRKSSQKEVKAKFIELAKKYHPDTGATKDPTKFKNILEAYRYLSDDSNWPTLDVSQGRQQQQKQRTQTDEQKTRRRTYQYFNETFRRRPTSGGLASGSMGYDSFYQTIKSAPELKIYTLGFLGLAIMIWVFMATSMKPRNGRRKVVHQKIFYSKQEEREYRQKKRKQKQKQFYKKLNFSQRFKGKKNQSSRDKADQQL